MEFVEDQPFPGCPKFGAVSEPDYDVTIVRTAGNWEYRNLHASQSMRRISLTVGPGPELDEEVQDVLDFWHALAGPHVGFRYQDRADWKSCRVRGTPAPTDQPLVQVEGAVWQLVKRYQAGSQYRDKEIRKPVGSSIVIADNGTLKTAGVHYTLDETTGLVTLGFSPAGTLTWGGEYHVPVRFDSTFPLEQLQFRVQSVTFSLREFRT